MSIGSDIDNKKIYSIIKNLHEKVTTIKNLSFDTWEKICSVKERKRERLIEV